MLEPKILRHTGKIAHDPEVLYALDDEDEGSLPRSRVNRREQVVLLDAGKIERSADAFQMLCICLYPGMNQPNFLQA